MKQFLTRLIGLTLPFAIPSVAFSSQDLAKRPFSPSDLYQLSEFSQDFAVSPSGDLVAYVIKRPLAKAINFMQDGLAENDLADVWVMPVKGGTPKRITPGNEDQFGYWSPTWSPDGKHLALLSSRNDGTQIWVWSKATGKLKQLTNRSAKLYNAEGPHLFKWVSNNRVICVLLPFGEKPEPMNAETQAAEAAMKAWPKAWKGKETTASVLQSGYSLNTPRHSNEELGILNLSGEFQSIVASQNFLRLEVSPNRAYTAILSQFETVKMTPEKLTTWKMEIPRYRLLTIDNRSSEVTSLNGSELLALVSLPESCRWSPDSSKLVLSGKKLGSQSAPIELLLCQMITRSCESVITDSSLEKNDPWKTLAWSAGNELLLLHSDNFHAQDQDKEVKNRKDWWSMSTGEPPRNLTQHFSTIPEEWIAQRGQKWIGLESGQIWEYDFEQTTVGKFSEKSALTDVRILWPPSEIRMQLSNISEILVEGIKDGKKGIYYVNLESKDELQLVDDLPSNCFFHAFDPQSKTMYLSNSSRNGTTLYRVEADQTLSEIVTLNSFLKEITEGKVTTIQYQSLKKKELQGWLILPVHFQEGKQYPLIVWVYGGLMHDPTNEKYFSINKVFPDAQLFAARGYAVLIPSMPLPSEDSPSDPLFDLSDGVLPAIDQVIKMGIAHPERVGLIGHSYGGYSVYGLITQTNRFKAAVASAGIADLLSFYGTFYTSVRYSDHPLDVMFPVRMSESGQMRMGSPPWRDRERYIRNSPITYVDKVNTPLMIIQGDLDFVSIQQGEQFFTSLYRQNKKVEFVRYWGEGHVIRGHANLIDMWNRIFEWFKQI